MATASIQVEEDEESAVIDIVRNGLDLSKPANVWCTTKMVSDHDRPATPSIDYVPISRKVSFAAGQSRAVSTDCSDIELLLSAHSLMRILNVSPDMEITILN